MYTYVEDALAAEMAQPGRRHSSYIKRVASAPTEPMGED